MTLQPPSDSARVNAELGADPGHFVVAENSGDPLDAELARRLRSSMREEDGTEDYRRSTLPIFRSAIVWLVLSVAAWIAVVILWV